jgi:hypothetical protein
MRLLWVYLAVVFAFTTLLTAQANYRYTYVPKTVYENQIFALTISSSLQEKSRLVFDTTSPIQALFKDPLEVQNGNETFYTFYFKAKKTDLLIPKLFISSSQEETSLDGQIISLSSLKPEGNFSSVLASDLKIVSQQVSNYDAQNHIVTLKLEAYEANLEDMLLPHVIESDIDTFKRIGAKVTSEYYAVLPREQKSLSFSYYNTIKRDFVTLTVPVKVADASVTTQSDLNPKVDAFERLKRYALIFFSGFFIIMFLWKRDFFYLVLGIIAIITLLTFYIPHKKTCIKQGSPLYILPSHTSTISMYIDDKLDTMELGIRGDFIKVQTKTKIIGWIKNEDTCKP